MAKDALKIEDLETATAEVASTTKTKKEKTPPTAEEIAALEAACEKIRAFGVSDEFSRVLGLVPMWHDTEANANAKAKVIESFGGSDKFKDYVDSTFQTELAVIAGLSKVASTLNNVKSFYARRENTGVKKSKMVPVNMDSVAYLVNADYFASLAGMSREEKKAALLAHADTKKNDTVEVL